MDREPPKGSKWPAEGLHYTWGSTRGDGYNEERLWNQDLLNELHTRILVAFINPVTKGIFIL